MASPDDFTLAGLRTINGEHCQALAMDLGATVLSWRPTGQDDVLFLSRDAAVGPGLETHGGIPICAPWFSGGREGVTVPRIHGLARWVPWRLVEEVDTPAGTRLAWELEAPEFADAPGADAYPPDLRFRHEVTFGAELTLRFTITSPTLDCVVDEAFHSYFRVPARQTRILGLDQIPFRDFAVDADHWAPSDEALVPDRHVDRVYRGAAEVMLDSPTRRVVIRPAGAGSVIVWNPGPDVPDDFAPDEWVDMVCVEVGNVLGDAVTIPAGGSHTLAMTVSVLPSPPYGSGE